MSAPPASLRVLSPPLVLWLLAGSALAARDGQLEIRAVDHDTGQPVAVRMHVTNARGRPFLPRSACRWHDHFVFSGTAVLDLPPGQYTFQMHRGPEYRVRTGNFTVQPGATDNTQVDMQRMVDMSQSGWWAGDLQVHRAPRDIPLLMSAEDLHVAPVVTWSVPPGRGSAAQTSTTAEAGPNRFYDLMAGHCTSDGGPLLAFGLDKPLQLPLPTGQPMGPLDFLEPARQHPRVHVDLPSPLAWDMPLWVALGQIDSIGVANTHQQPEGTSDERPGERQRDRLLFPPPHGIGRWSEAIYHHLLNCGLRIPPSAGSGSGDCPNPVGYNRVYVHCGSELTYDKWWEGLRGGRVVVTNGPMLQPLVNGQLPGHEFRAFPGDTVELNTTLHLATRDKIDYLELVQNGEVVQHVRLDKYAEAGGKLPAVTFRQSGWMLVRAITNHEKSYRFAMSGPYYVRFEGSPRISRRSAQLFVDWVYARARQVQQADRPNGNEVLRLYRKARDYWQNLVDNANAE